MGRQPRKTSRRSKRRTFRKSPGGSICDNPSNQSSGRNFLQDERCRWPVDGKRWLWEKIQADPAKRGEWFDPSTGRINRNRVADYMDEVVEFRMQLLACMHTTGGGPARAPEILSVRHENTPKGEHRNMFVEDGLVTFVAKYHKGYAMSGDVKIPF